MLIKINNIPKIRSYQTLVYKNGSRTFRKKEYIEYFKYFTENAKFKASARYSFGWTDPRSIYGSAGA